MHIYRVRNSHSEAVEENGCNGDYNIPSFLEISISDYRAHDNVVYVICLVLFPNRPCSLSL